MNRPDGPTELAIPIIPIGTDAYVHWARLPTLRIGVRAYMRSTWDRTGNNHGWDGGQFLYQESDAFNVVVDERGPGILYFVRTNHFHGSPWHYEVDGTDFVVTETGSANPVGADQRNENPEFLPAALFPHGLTHTWRETQGGDIMQVPMAFETSLRFALSRTYYGTSYAVLHKFALGATHFSKELRAWTPEAPDEAAVHVLESAGTNLTADVPGQHDRGGAIVRADETVILANLVGPQSIRSLMLRVRDEDAEDLSGARLRMYWDGSPHASVDAPIALFFGVGRLFNVNPRDYLSKGLLANVHYDGSYATLRCYWPMPFFESARIEITGTSAQSAIPVEFELDTCELDSPRTHTTHFHATYTDHPAPEEGKYITFLDTQAVEGGGPWAGHVVGLAWIFTHSGRVMPTVEGHPKFTFDGSRTPQAVGTGTEEIAGGGDHWRSGQYSSLPLFGHPLGRMGGKADDDPRELLNSAYRFFLADLFPFGNRALIELKHGDRNNSKEHYEGVTFWYGVNDAALILTDFVEVCADTKHHLVSEGAQAPYELRSRFEDGPHEDYPGQREYTEETEGLVRITLGTTEFSAKITPDNLGLLLRRRFDFRYPIQCAEVFVQVEEGWALAGEWYTPGSSTCVYSRPDRGNGNFTSDELLPTEHVVIDSKKRWKEEEFLIGAQLTKGRDQIRIRIRHVPIERDLFPGMPYPERSAWSESSYSIYSYVLPRSRN